jgi:hypothetical protein
LSPIFSSKRNRLQTNEDIVLGFFRLIEDKNIDRLLNLFSEDSVVYEQFSNIEGGLRGRSAIEPFLRVSMMANDGLRHEIKFEKPTTQLNNGIANNNVINALVTFQKGDKIKARFAFEFDNSNESIDLEQIAIRRTIKTLSIQFLP